MGPARIYPWRKMRRSRALSIAPGTFFVAQSWVDCITNMPGFNLRQAQRAETTVDLSGSSMLPFPNVPCSPTPPQSPVTIASCGDLLLPSSQYDAVGLRVTTITGLHRFTCVTARPSLVPTLNSCRCLHEPKARFPVGRLVPLSGAGISPAGSIRLFLTHHIGGVARREWGGKECALPSQRRERLAHPSPKINASVPRCDISCTTPARD